MSTTAILYEGKSAIYNGFNHRFCERLKEMSAVQYAEKYLCNRGAMVAPFNDLLQFDPVEGYMHPNTIFKYVSMFSGQKDRAALAFELTVVRAAKEIAFQSSAKLQELFKKKDLLNLVKEIFENDYPIVEMSTNLVAQVTKAFLRLKAENFFSDDYIPDVVTSPNTFSIKKAVSHLKEHYKIEDLGYNLGFEINLDQYIAQNVTPKLTEISNLNSKMNFRKWLTEHPEKTEIYALLGVNHLDIISDSLKKFKSSTEINFKPIDMKLTLKSGRKISLHVFPDRHGVSYAYNAFMKYAEKKHLKIPDANQAKELATNLACNQNQIGKDTYFTDQEISFLICNSVNKFKRYSLKACESIVQGNGNFSENFEICNKEKNLASIWYNDLLRKGLCSNNYKSCQIEK